MDIQLDFAPVLNLRRSPRDDRDFPLEMFLAAPPAALPEAYDACPDIMPRWSQESTSQCAWFAAGGWKEVQEQREGKPKCRLSPRWGYEQRPDPTRPGTDLRSVMKLLQSRGMPSNASYPFGGSLRLNPNAPKLVVEAAANRITGYARVASIESYKRAVIENGGVLMGLPVYDTGRVNFWHKTYLNSGSIGGHGVFSAKYVREGAVIANSWGPNYGKEGYAVLPWSDWLEIWDMYTGVDLTGAASQPVPVEHRGFWAWLRGLVGR